VLAVVGDIIQAAQHPGFEEIVAGGDAMPRLRRVSQPVRCKATATCPPLVKAISSTSTTPRRGVPASRATLKKPQDQTDHRGRRGCHATAFEEYQGRRGCHASAFEEYRGRRDAMPRHSKNIAAPRINGMPGLKNASVIFLRVFLLPCTLTPARADTRKTF